MDSLKSPHAHTTLVFDDGSREVMKARHVMGAMASRLQCSHAYSGDLDVWICLLSPQHLPTALLLAITHSM